mmetsp:Transcript_35507/g.40452  ORF Transcript_35507/g.40452 Transcript_35507/m.40452 type:complete len:95 (-) Transcript_35507:47-331(-)|eukprot:CAMPEP_0194147094 /NCGR_PEP_ID=MMETSP0152-20130528/22520_1 /TAXON_ID=1049557 /ORGANISM="Thalassiothrix antarctica, Strain L6-D1" /LENGTH=94 /DNA_ID=CAMNT_0038847785 /DNA_START=62 /DNA_END=346 /DNA_ORIENTATION=-
MSSIERVDGGKGDEENQPKVLSMFVDEMLDQMQSKFTTMGDSIMGRMNKMGTRMDELETSIGDLMGQAGLEPPPPSTPPSPKANKEQQTRRISI